MGNASRIQAKNGLENYCYSMKNTMNDEKLKGKVSEEDKATIMGKVEETIKWLDANRERRIRSKTKRIGRNMQPNHAKDVLPRWCTRRYARRFPRCRCTTSATTRPTNGRR